MQLIPINDVIQDIRKRTKAGALGRKERMDEIAALIDRYELSPGKDAETIDRLTNLVLYEELTDPRPDKMTLEEYPIMSETQREERVKDEVASKLAEEVATDGRNYRVPSRDSNRNMRKYLGQLFRDEDARSRNKERRRAYEEFTKVQPIITYTIER